MSNQDFVLTRELMLKSDVEIRTRWHMPHSSYGAALTHIQWSGLRLGFVGQAGTEHRHQEQV